MIFTDDYIPFHKEADYCEEKNETQDRQIEELQNKLKLLKDEVQEMQNTINGLDFKIDDKYEAQTQTLSQNITEAVNTLQNNLANNTTTALVITDHINAGDAVLTNDLQARDVNARGVVNADMFTGNNIDLIHGRIGEFLSDFETIQKSTIYYLNAVNATINSLNLTSLSTDDFNARLAIIDSLTSSMSTITRLNADLITVSGDGEWHEPTAQPANDELLKVSFPYYDGIVNIISQNDSLNLSIVNNTLVTFNQKDPNLYRVDFNKVNRKGHFTYSDEGGITLPQFKTGTLEVTINEHYHTVMELVYGEEKSVYLSDRTYVVYDGGTTVIMSYPYGANPVSVFDCILETPKPTIDLYFRKSFNYKELHIGGDKYEESFSEIVDRTLYENNVNTLEGTVSATDIIYGDNINVSVLVLDELPDAGSKNVIYVVRNDRSYFYNNEDEKFEPMSLKTDIVNGHTTKGRIDENLIYPATQYTPDYSFSAFSGTFYEVTDFIESDQIPEGAKLMYLENGNIKFCNTLPPFSGTQFGMPSSVLDNKRWFENIIWYSYSVTGTPFMIPLPDFEYKTPAITISDEAGHSASVATQPVQAYVDYRQNAINNLLDLRSSENRMQVTQNTEDIATNKANIETNTADIKAINDAKGQPNGFASLDSEGHLPVEQLPTSALVYKGQWDASTGAYPVQTSYTIGDFYIVSVEGNIGDIHFYVGDWIIWDGTTWERSANVNAVASVNDKTGAVVLRGTDIKLGYNTNVNINNAIKYCLGDDAAYTFTYDNVIYTVVISGTSGITSTWAPSVYTYTATGSMVLYKMSQRGWVLSYVDPSTVTLAVTPMMSLVIADSFINWTTKQDKLVSGTSIKTINNKSLLGSGNITLADLGISIV